MRWQQPGDFRPRTTNHDYRGAGVPSCGPHHGAGEARRNQRPSLRSIPDDSVVSCNHATRAFVTSLAGVNYMNGKRPNFRLAAGGALLSLMLAIAGAWAQSGAPKAPVAPAGPKLAEEQYKNIQALKGIPSEQGIPSMQFIAASLGVECEYCHSAHANEKDDKKPKVTARKMINMMMAINKDNFGGHRVVTCYSCHRGATDPVATPILTDEEGKKEAEEGKKPGKPKPPLPLPDHLPDKYLVAVGGAEAFQKISSRVQKGTLIAFGGRHFPVDVYSKAPDQRFSVIHLPGGDRVTAFRRKRGWGGSPGHW